MIAMLSVACGARLDGASSDAMLGDDDAAVGRMDARADAALPAWGMPTLVPGMPMTTAEIDDPTLTSDMLEMYFNLSDDIYVTKRTSITSAWSQPVIDAALSSASGETTPDISGDGLTMYFASNRPGGLGDTDIWRSVRGSRTETWGVPVNVAELSSANGDATAAMTADQLMLVTTSNRADGGVSYDMYISTRATVGAPWGPLAPLDALDVGQVDDTSGFLSPDGLTIYWDSGGDISYAVRASRTAAFGAPMRITEVNVAGKRDFDPWVSPDGRHMFMASDRGGALALYESTR
jgi:hypothetical protein